MNVSRRLRPSYSAILLLLRLPAAVLQLSPLQNLNHLRPHRAMASLLRVPHSKQVFDRSARRFCGALHRPVARVHACLTGALTFPSAS